MCDSVNFKKNIFKKALLLLTLILYIQPFVDGNTGNFFLNKINPTENEKRDIIKYLELGKPLPDKYRFLLFED